MMIRPTAMVQKILLTSKLTYKDKVYVIRLECHMCPKCHLSHIQHRQHMTLARLNVFIWVSEETLGP